MVMPKLPFSLFDFKYIDQFEPYFKTFSVAAGEAIPTTTIYTCPDHKFTLLLMVTVALVKGTATALTCTIQRATRDGVAGIAEYLMQETVGTSILSWPNSKASTSNGLGLTLVFLWAGDSIVVEQALTAAETIAHKWAVYRIEYRDPRYEK